MQVVTNRSADNRTFADQKRVAIFFDKDIDKVNGPSRNRVKPEFFKETRIDVIMQRALRTGIQMVKPHPGFGVVSGADYLQKQNALIDVQKYFDSLPSETRDFFANSPKNMVDFVCDPKNREQAIELGLIEKPKEVLVPGAPVKGGSDFAVPAPAPVVVPPVA